MNILLQLLLSFSLITGVICGEFFSKKAFGAYRNKTVGLIDIFLFITLLVLTTNLVLVGATSILLLPLEFILGFSAVLSSRVITCGAGFLSKRFVVKKELILEPNQDSLIISLIMNLKRSGLSYQKIIDSLTRSGFPAKKVRNNITELAGIKRNKRKSS